MFFKICELDAFNNDSQEYMSETCTLVSMCWICHFLAIYFWQYSVTLSRGTTPFRSKARWVKLLISLERHFRNLDRVEDPKRFH